MTSCTRNKNGEKKISVKLALALTWPEFIFIVAMQGQPRVHKFKWAHRKSYIEILNLTGAHSLLDGRLSSGTGSVC